MERQRHMHNSRVIGVYYTTDAGHSIYLGHRQLRHLNRKFNAWTIDSGTLNRCRARGVTHVGIICRRNGVKHVWLSRLDDWFDPDGSFTTRSKKFGVERGIRLKHFRVDPGNDFEKIGRALNIR